MNILISAGPTREYIDDVRFLSNASSGLMGYEIARIAHKRGHKVTLVTGPTHLTPPPVTVVPVESANEMREAMLARMEEADVVIMAAAVSDYRPAKRIQGKAKKGARTVVLRLVLNPDIVAELAERRQGQLIVGFAVESDNLLDNARKKLIDKHLDLIVANPVASIGAARTTLFVLDREGVVATVKDRPKRLAAARILNVVESAAANRHS